MGGQNLDLELLNHVLYGEAGIDAIGNCKTPQSGKVGTPAKLNASDQLTIQTKTYCNEYSGTWQGTTVTDTLNYVTLLTPTTYKAITGDTNKVSSVYTPTPSFPTLDSNLVATSNNITAAGTYSPNTYNELNIGSNITVYLTAGEYTFNKIMIGSNSKVIITPDVNGEYKSIILIYYAGGADFTMISTSKMVGTIIAPNGNISFNNQSSLVGQALSKKKVSINGFDGGIGIDFKPLIQSNISITPPDTLYEDLTSRKNIDNLFTNRTSDTTIVATLSEKIPTGGWASFDYEFIEGTAKRGTSNLVDVVYANTFNAVQDTLWRTILRANDGTIDFDLLVKNVKDSTIAGKTVKVIEDSLVFATSGTVPFAGGDIEKKLVLQGTAKTLFIKIYDDEKYEEPGEIFSIKFSNAQSYDKTKFEIKLGGDTVRTMTIVSDDPNNTAPKNLAFTAQRTIEHYVGIPVQTVGTFSAVDEQNNPITYQVSSIKDAGNTARDAWFEIQPGTNKLVTTSSYRADYETATQQSFTATATATDGTLTGAPLPISFSISPWNDNKLQVKPDAQTVNEGASATIDVLANDTPDADLGTNLKKIIGVSKDSVVSTTLSYVSVRGATVATNGTQCTYNDGTTPAATEVPFSEVFYYTVRDTADYEYTTAHHDSVVRVTMTIVNQNDNTPVANAATVPTVFEGEANSIAVSGTDADGDALLIASVSGGTQGTFSMSSDKKSIIYTHTGSNESPFTDAGTFTLTDGTRTSAAVAVSVAIKPINDNKADASDDSTKADGTRYSVQRGTSAVSFSVADGILKNDTDADRHPTEANNGNVMTVSLKGSPTTAKGGIISLNGDGSFTYNPAGVISGTTEDQFVYYLDDSISYKATSKSPFSYDKVDSATVKILVTPNYSTIPTATSKTLTVKEKTGAEGTATQNLILLASDSDAPEDGLTYAISKTTGLHGTFTLFGTNLTYVYTATADKELPFLETVDYTVTDKGNNKATATITVAITKLNDNAAVINNESTTCTRGGSVTALNVLANDTDADQLTPENRLTITNFTILPARHRAGTTVSDQGVVTYLHDGNAIGADSIITVTYTTKDTTFGYDGEAKHTGTGVLTIKIIPDFSKNPPVLAQRSFAVKEQVSSRDSVVISSILSDGDIADGDEVTLTITNNDSYGGASFTGDVTTLKVNKANIGSAYLRYTYTDAAVTTEQFTGSFSISATDSRSPVTAQGTDTETYSVVIDTLNDNIPVVAKKTVTVPFGKARTIPLPTIADSDEPSLMNIAGIDSTISLGGKKGVTILPLHGTVNWLSESQYTYTPDINAIALRDSFEYQVLDSLVYDAVNRHRVKAWIVIDLDQSSKDKPIAVDDNFTLIEDGTFNGNVKTNDLKATVGGVANTGPALTTVTLVTAPVNHSGTFTLNADGTFAYQHKDVELFTDKFTYTVSDAGAKTSFEGTVYLTITPRNEKTQVIAANTGSVNEKDSVKILVIDANDTDIDQYPSEPTNIVLTGVSSVPTYGTVKFDADKKSILYVVDPAKTDQLKKGEIKTDVFTVETSDSVTYDKPATHRVNNQVTITITGLNDNTPSGATDLTMTVDENVDTTSAAGKTDTLDLSSIVTDADQDVLTVEVTQGSVGTAKVIPGTMKISYKHNLNDEVFADQFTYTVSDGVFKSSPKVVTVEILKKNDNKITTKNDSVSVSEKGTNQVNVSLNNSSDADVETTLKYSATNGTNGSASVDAYGVVTYVHTKNLELTAVLRDTVVVTVTDTVSYDPTVGNRVEDTVFVTITPVNDHTPVIATADTISVYEGKSSSTINLRALVNDADGEIAKINFSSNTTLGTVASSATDAVIYTHLGAEPAVLNGVYDQITFTASDADTSISGTVVIKILNRNDTPAQGVRNSYPVVENVLLTVSADSGVLANDVDADLPVSENRLKAVFGTQAKNGKVTLSADGSFTYEPNAAGTEFAVDSFTYIVVDSSTYETEIHSSSPITVELMISNVNDEKPLSANDTIDVIESGKAVILRSGASSVLSNDADLDKDVLTATLLDSTTTGSIALASDGTFEYVHSGSEIYSDMFTYVATDGVHFDTATVTVVIAPKAPVVQTASYLDLNADGTVDQIRAVFNHTVDLSKTSFAATWSDATAPVLGTATFETASAKNIVVIPVIASTLNKTAGTMQLSIVHGGFGNQNDSITIKDSAAPVVASGFYQVMGANALLTVTMSETMQWNSEVPFSFILNKKELVVPVGATAPATGTSYTFALPASTLAIAPNDSIFVNVLGAVSDGINVQVNPNNIRRPFVFENNIASAIYRDTSSIADGKIDQIKLTSATGTSISDSTLLAGLASGLILPRGLKFVSIVSDSNGCVLNVTDSATTGKVSTAVSVEDTLSTAGSISSINGGTIGKISGLKILDGIAPVINSAWYQIETRSTGGIDTILTVLYSEPVKQVPAIGASHPFGFYDVSVTSPFTMDLTNDAKENRFLVTNQSIDYVVDGDSIRIERNLAVYDSVGNAQEMSVWAPIRVSLDYGIELRILIFPQPLVLTRDEDDRVTAAELDSRMRDHYRFSDNGIDEKSGVAFVVEATGPLSPTGKHSATAQILDQTGNMVSDKFDFVFGTKEGGNLAGIAVWNGRNKTGRPVGAGSYLLAIDASVETDEGEKSRVITKQFIKTVGVNVR